MQGFHLVARAFSRAFYWTTNSLSLCVSPSATVFVSAARDSSTKTRKQQVRLINRAVFWPILGVLKPHLHVSNPNYALECCVAVALRSIIAARAAT